MASIYNYLHYVPEVNTNNINDKEFMKEHDEYVEYLRTAQEYFEYFDSMKDKLALDLVQKIYSSVFNPKYSNKIPDLYKNKISEIENEFYRLKDEYLTKRDPSIQTQEQSITEALDSKKEQLDKIQLDYNALLIELEKYASVPQVATQIQNVKTKNAQLDSINLTSKSDYEKVIQGKKEIIDYLNKANNFIKSSLERQQVKPQQQPTEHTEQKVVNDLWNEFDNSDYSKALASDLQRQEELRKIKEENLKKFEEQRKLDMQRRQQQVFQGYTPDEIDKMLYGSQENSNNIGGMHR